MPVPVEKFYYPRLVIALLEFALNSFWVFVLNLFLNECTMQAYITDLLNIQLDMEFLEVLTEGIDRVLMIRGSGNEVITIYS